jgi:hypothetical protein
MFEVIDNSALRDWEQMLDDHSPAGLTLGEAREILAACPNATVSPAASDLARLIDAMERAGRRSDQRPDAETWRQLLPAPIRPPAA